MLISMYFLVITPSIGCKQFYQIAIEAWHMHINAQAG